MSENYWKQKWSKEQIQAMLLEQFETFWTQQSGIERTQLAEIERLIPLPHSVIISGLRRVGKSTLLAQLAHKLGESTFYYLNFEDERFLGFQVDEVNDLYQELVEIFGPRKIFVVDEIQNLSGWEHFVRRFMDMGFKFFVTGSNASLLSRELGNRLTGRYLPIELFPFSFVEFLRFRQSPIPDVGRLTTAERATMQHALLEYLRLGGIPDPLKYPDLPLLRTLYDDVLYRDIATRYRIEEVTALKELAYYLISNTTAPISFNKLKDQFRLGSVNTIKNYIDYLENSWLLFTLNIYAYSVKRQQIAPKKVYAIDTGLVNAVGFSFSANTGKLLENLAFLTLRRRDKNIYYALSASGYEVDFYLPEKRQLIQVTQSLINPATKERECRGLMEVMSELNLSSGIILTDSNQQAIIQDGRTIEIRSILEWLVTDGAL